MSHPDPELLAGIAADPSEASAADVAHLVGCPACAAEVADLRRVVSLVRSAPDPVWTAPPADVWERIVQQVGEHDDAAAPAVGPAPVALAPASLDAARRAGARTRSAARSSGARQAATARRSARPWGWVLAAAAAGVAVGLVGGRVLWPQPAAPTTVLAQTPLETLDSARSLGEADLVRHDDAVNLRVGLQPVDPGQGYLEVWLINRDLKRMVSVGVLGSTAGSADFPVSQALLDQGYVIVDVSREGFDDRPQHSGDSIVRGTLPL